MVELQIKFKCTCYKCKKTFKLDVLPTDRPTSCPKCGSEEWNWDNHWRTPIFIHGMATTTGMIRWDGLKVLMFCMNPKTPEQGDDEEQG